MNPLVDGALCVVQLLGVCMAIAGLALLVYTAGEDDQT